MDEAALAWSARRTSHADDWPLDRVARLKGDTTVAVVIPARDEAATVGGIVAELASSAAPLIDELVVMDSLSSDDTAAVAAAAGADVRSVADVRPDLGVRPGKGEALWKSAFVTTADVLVFVDADLTEWGAHFVPGLLGPLLDSPAVVLSKGAYDRVLQVGDRSTLEGGRVTELVARPWLAVHRPELSAVVQPLAGEWAVRRRAFEALRVPCGYGIEMATLLDVHRSHGLDAIAQVDLGRRAHAHQGLDDLGAMAVEILVAAERRRGGAPPASLSLPRRDGGGGWTDHVVSTDERPPVRAVPPAPRSG